MPFIYLQKFGNEETIRVNPDEILMVEPHAEIGSMVTFKAGDSLHFSETKKQVERKEWIMRYGYPNLERLIVAGIGGVIGSLVTILVNLLCHLPHGWNSLSCRHEIEIGDVRNSIADDCFGPIARATGRNGT